MNRLSELQTIVRIANICNKNGLIKEADQLLNIFTKLAQENPEFPEDKQQNIENEETGDTESDKPKTDQTQETQTEALKPDMEIDQTLIDDLNEYITTSQELFEKLQSDTPLEEMKQSLPDLTRVIDLSRTILNNPNIDADNKKNISEVLPEILKIQESLKTN